VSKLIGLNGQPLSATPEFRPADGESASAPDAPPWLSDIAPGSRIVIAGFWWRIEQAVTNGEGQWALILTPQEESATARKKRRKEEQ
jgi:hypothetical protein